VGLPELFSGMTPLGHGVFCALRCGELSACALYHGSRRVQVMPLKKS
jgi:hypothetical protein